MPPKKDEEETFGSAALRAQQEKQASNYVSSYEDIVARSPQRVDTPIQIQSQANRYVQPYDSIGGIGAERTNPISQPLSIRFADDPKELRRQQIQQRVTSKVQAYEEQLLNENPEYYYSLVEPDNEHARFGAATKTAFALEFAARSNYFKEQAVEDELTLFEEGVRGTRKLGALGRFVGSFVQDIPRMIASGTVANFAMSYKNGKSLFTGEEPVDHVILEGDSWWYKLLIGQEVERDVFGRITKKTPRDIPSTTYYLNESNRMVREYQEGKLEAGEERNAFDDAGMVMFTALAVPAFYIVQLDVGILPIATVTKLSKGFIAGSRAALKIAENVTTVLKTGGKVIDKTTEKAIKAVAKEAGKAKNSLDAQRIVNKFLLENLPDGSDAAKVVRGIDNSINVEITEARATLDEIALNSPDLDSFRANVDLALQAERNLQQEVLSRNLLRVGADDAIQSGRAALTSTFRKFGEGVLDDGTASIEDVLKAQLKKDTPAEVKAEFETLKDQLSTVLDTKIAPIQRQLQAVSNNVPLGSGPFDLTKNLLNDSKGSLDDLTETIFNNLDGRRGVAAEIAKGGDITGKSADEVLDALDTIQKQTSLARNKTGSAVRRVSDFLYAESVARGSVARRALAEVPIEASVPAPKIAPVSPVNKQVFDNVKLSIGDTVLQAADDAASAASFEDFVKNSEEVVYQGAGDNQFIRDVGISDAIVKAEINPPVVLDMRQPLKLDDITDLVPEEIAKEMQGIDFGDITGKPMEVQFAQEFLDSVSPLGFDGVIFKQEVDGVVTTGRIVLNEKQVIPADMFYDNIKGGKDAFGDGMSLAARRQNQTEDILEKMLPKTPGMKGVENYFSKIGLGVDMSKKAANEFHARLLDAYLVDLDKNHKILNQFFTVTDDAGKRIDLYIDKDGLKVSLDEGNDILVKTTDEIATLYKATTKAFEKDAVQRVTDLATKQVAGGITEAKFVAKGPGAKKFNTTLNQRVKEGIFLPEEALLVRTAMKDMSDKVLDTIAPLETSIARRLTGRRGSSINARVNGQFKLEHSQIILARGLAYIDTRAAMRSGNKLKDVGAIGTEVFLHEFGHIGHKVLLDASQKKMVTKVWESLSDKELKAFFGRGPGTIDTITHHTSSEAEFFAQAFAEYTMKNRLIHADFLPLFERITKQLTNSLKSLFTKKSTIASGKVDELNPLFDQILRGQSGARTAAKKSVKEEEVYFSAASDPKRSRINGNDRNFKNRQPLVSRKVMEESRRLQQGLPQGKGMPEDLLREASATPPPPKLPKGITGKPAETPKFLDAKIPDNINKMDIKDPKLSESLNDVEVFGKGTRVHKSLRLGQKRLASTVKKMQGHIISKDKQFTETVVKLAERREAALARAKLRFDTAEDVKKELLRMMRVEEQTMAMLKTTWSSASAREIAGMAGKVKTQAQLTKALNRMSELADLRIRGVARDRIGKIITRTEKGTRDIPPFWQEKIEDAIGTESIRLKLFRKPYQERLEDLQKFLLKEGNESTTELFESAKTLRMLEDLKELQKKSISKFKTTDLIKLVHRLDSIYEEGKAAQFVIKGGKTKELSTQVPDGLNAKGVPQTKKFIVQKGGIEVTGLEQLIIDNNNAIIEEAVKAGKVKSLDNGKVVAKFGDLEAVQWKGVYEGLKDLRKPEKLKELAKLDTWQRGLMTYLTADRTIELMDNMKPRGPIYQLIQRPLRESINKGEKAGNKAITGLVDMERALTKEFKVVDGGLSKAEQKGRVLEKYRKPGNGFTNANYERIAIHAYLKQNLKGKLKNLVSDADIAKVEASGLMPHEVKMYEYMREELDKLWPSLDDVMRNEHGVRISKIENYFPIQNNVLDNRTMTEVLNIEYIPNKRAVSKGFTEKRYVTSDAQMRMNAREIFKKHVRDVNYFTQVEPQIQRAAKITKSQDFLDNVGVNASMWFDQYIDIIARRGTPKNYDFNGWDTARRNLGAATLGYNLSPILKQPLAAFAGIGILGPKSVAIDGYGLMYKHNLFDAIGDVSIEQSLRAADDPAFVDLSLSGKLSQLQEGGYYAIKKTDAHTARGIWLAAYTKNINGKGKLFSPEDFKSQIGIDKEAIDYADMIVRKTQGSGKFQDLPLLLTNKNKKIFTYAFQFQSFVLSQSQLLTHDALHSLIQSTRGVSEESIIDATGKAVGISAWVGAGIYLEQQISAQLTSLYGSEGAKKYQEELGVGGKIDEGFQAALPVYGFFKDITNPDQTGLGVPVIDKVYRGAKNFTTGFFPSEGTKPKTSAKAKSVAVEAGVALGLGLPGTGQLAGLVRNLIIEPAFDTPADNVKESIENGDAEEFQYLIEKYAQEGLDVDEILKKVNSSLESGDKSTRKDVVKKYAQALANAESKKEVDAALDMLIEGVKDGTLTEEHVNEIEAEAKRLTRLKSIGE